jgi:hypothetical protein
MPTAQWPPQHAYPPVHCKTVDGLDYAQKPYVWGALMRRETRTVDTISRRCKVYQRDTTVVDADCLIGVYQDFTSARDTFIPAGPRWYEGEIRLELPSRFHVGDSLTLLFDDGQRLDVLVKRSFGTSRYHVRGDAGLYRPPTSAAHV